MLRYKYQHESVSIFILSSVIEQSFLILPEVKFPFDYYIYFISQINDLTFIISFRLIEIE